MGNTTSILKRLLNTALLWGAALTAMAQSYGVEGRVCEDAEDGAALPLAKVQLLTKDSALVAEQVTGNDGSFRLKAKGAGAHIVQVSFLGYENLTRNVALTTKKPLVRMGDLRLRFKDVQLGEAEVTALSSVLTIKADTFVYSTKAMRIPPGSSLSVLIKQMPGLEMNSEGKLTFQGKEVGSILVNGKEFFGDNVTALQNMPADAIQDLKAYDKTDEEKQFRGEVDADKQTVLDLSIKKEYLASWNINADAAYGTNERYVGKVFATSFTDRHRVAVFGSVNNVSENQQVDENGNWRHWSYPDGIYTYRSAGTMFSWDNGKDVKENGYMKASVNGKLTHDDQNRDAWNNAENFLPDGTAHHSYSTNHQRYHDVGASASGTLWWNVDSMNRIRLSAGYNFSGDKRRYEVSTSVYDREQETDHPDLGLLGDDVPPELREQGIYSLWAGQLTNKHGFSSSASAEYTHLFNTEGRSLSMRAYYYGNHDRQDFDNLTRYLYFQPSAPQPEQLLRHYHDTPTDADAVDASITYSDRLAEKWRYHLSYGYQHLRNADDRLLYYLNEYDRYNSLLLPVGARPSTIDSIEAVRNAANSYEGTLFTNLHKGSVGLEGQWEKSEIRFNLDVANRAESLFYERGGQTYKPHRSNVEFSPSFYYKWKFAENGQVFFRYYGGRDYPNLTALIPVSDTSDDMQVTVNNPNLKNSWTNTYYINGNWFGSKRGDSYSLYAYCSQYLNATATTRQIDPVSGASYSSMTNVDGNYYMYYYLGTEQPLDSARHWIISVGTGSRNTRDRSYIGADGDAQGLSTIRRFYPFGRIRLRWRQDIWSVSLSADYEGSLSRYANLPAYNESGHTAYATLAPQVELPFGLRISTDICYYRRFNFSDPIMNHRQLLWNANISQTFLKSKALTVQLEAVDILRERTAEFNSLSATGRLYSRVKAFLSYTMLHVIYRFNLKRK